MSDDGAQEIRNWKLAEFRRARHIFYLACRLRYPHEPRLRPRRLLLSLAIRMRQRKHTV